MTEQHISLPRWQHISDTVIAVAYFKTCAKIWNVAVSFAAFIRLPWTFSTAAGTGERRLAVVRRPLRSERERVKRLNTTAPHRKWLYSRNDATEEQCRVNDTQEVEGKGACWSKSALIGSLTQWGTLTNFITNKVCLIDLQTPSRRLCLSWLQNQLHGQ